MTESSTAAKLKQLMEGILSDTPSAQRPITRSSNPTTTRSNLTSTPVEDPPWDNLQARVNQLNFVAEGTDNLGDITGTSHDRPRPLFVDVMHDRNNSGDSTTEGQQMLSARSAGTTLTMGSSVVDVTPAKFDVFRVPATASQVLELCRSSLGGGVTACVRKNCKISHKGPKVTFPPGSILVTRSSGSVFMEPITHSRNVSDRVIREWESTAISLEDWSELFQLSNAQGVAEVLTPESLVAAQTFNRFAKEFRSPNRTQLTEEHPFGDKSEILQTFVKEEAEKLNLEFLERNLLNSDMGMDEDEEDPDFWVLNTGERELGAAFKKIENVGENNQILLTLVAEKLDKAAVNVNEELEVLLTKTQRFDSTLGQRVSHPDPERNAPTIWGNLSMCQMMFDKIKEDIDLLTNINEREMERTKKGLLGEIEKGIKLESSKATEAFAHQLDQLMDVMAVHSNGIEDVNESLLLMARGAAKVKGELVDVRSAMAEYREVPTATTGFSSTMEESSVVSDLSSLKGLVNTMGQRIDSVIDGRETKSLKFFGLTFRGHLEAESWVKTNLDNDSFGLILDVHLVFEHLFHAAFSDEGTLKDLNAMYKLKIDNLTHGLAMSSFDNPMPKFLSVPVNTTTKKPKVKKPGSSHFENVETWEDWDMPITGFRAQLKEQLECFEQTHTRMISELLDVEEPAYRVATSSVQSSVSWILSYTAYLDELYLEMIRLSSFNTQRAWQLVTQIGRRILTEVSVPRNGVKKLFRVGDNSRIAQSMIFPIMMSHEIMADYKRANWKDHHNYNFSKNGG